jgi:hypothetical protein
MQSAQKLVQLYALTTNQFLYASANAAATSARPWFVEEPLRVSKLQSVASCCIRNLTNADKLKAPMDQTHL